MKLRHLLSAPLFAISIASVSLVGLSGCDVSESEDSSEDDDGEGTGEVEEDGSENLGLESFRVYAESTDASYALYTSEDGDGETECVPSSSDEDIICILDMEELDLWARGVTLKIDAPGDNGDNDFACAYLYELPYYYRVFPYNYVTPSAYYVATLDGDMVDPSDYMGGVTGGTADIYYVINGTEYAHADLYGTAAESAGDVRCPWDYSSVSTVIDGQNCCVGRYLANEIAATWIDEDDDGIVDAPEEITIADNSAAGEWGGSIDACLSGAGVTDYDKRTSFGAIAATIHPVPQGGFKHEFAITSTSDRDNQNQIDIANYYSGTIPEPLEDGNPYYSYACLDHNKEWRFRINVQIREWNKSGELDKLVAGSSANPDSTGCEDTPFGALPINDYSDWKDYQDTGTPGYLLSSYGFDISGGAGSDIITILNLDGSAYDNTSRFLDFSAYSWGIDSCP